MEGSNKRLWTLESLFILNKIGMAATSKFFLAPLVLIVLSVLLRSVSASPVPYDGQPTYNHYGGNNQGNNNYHGGPSINWGKKLVIFNTTFLPVLNTGKHIHVITKINLDDFLCVIIFLHFIAK